jgi:hypothetical protein
MAKAKTPSSEPTTTSKSKTGTKLLPMPDSGNGNEPAYSSADLEGETRLRAYELYEQRGCEPGQEEQDWFAAEQEVRVRHDPHKHSA